MQKSYVHLKGLMKVIPTRGIFGHLKKNFSSLQVLGEITEAYNQSDRRIFLEHQIVYQGQIFYFIYILFVHND